MSHPSLEPQLERIILDIGITVELAVVFRYAIEADSVTNGLRIALPLLTQMDGLGGGFEGFDSSGMLDSPPKREFDVIGILWQTVNLEFGDWFTHWVFLSPIKQVSGRGRHAERFAYRPRG